MRTMLPRPRPSGPESLWTLFTAPVVWAVHFLMCYLSVAIYCAKQERFSIGFDVLRVVIGIATAVALVAILVSAWLAWRQWGFGAHDPPHDEPTQHDRTLFQGFATLLLSGLSFIAVVFVALPVLFMTECLR